MNDITPPQPDDLSKPAEELSQTIEGATNSVGDLAGSVEQKIDDTLQQAEEKLDGFIDGLENFLGKF